MIGMFLKLFDSSGEGDEVSFIIPLDLPLEAAALLLGDGILPFLVEKYDVEHTKDICSRMITGDYDYTLGKSFLTDVIKVSNIKRHGIKKPDSNVDEEKENRVLKSEITELDDWDVGGMEVEENPPAYSSAKVFLENREEVNQSTFQCTHCPTNFASRLTLKNHMKNEHGEKNFICSICSEGFTHQTHLKRHCRIEHKIRQSQTLKVNDLGGSDIRDDASKQNHDGILVRDLELAGEDPADPLSNTSQSMPAMPKAYECPICFAPLKNMRGIKKHIDNVHGEKNRLCRICNKSFTNQYDVTRHMRQVHKIEAATRGIRSWKNDVEVISENEITLLSDVICKEESPPLSEELTGEDVKEDSVTPASPSTPATSKQYKCDKCSSVINSRANFLYHQQRVHGAKDFKCSICTKGFTTPYKVKLHLRRAHKIYTVKLGVNSLDKEDNTTVMTESSDQNSETVISKTEIATKGEKSNKKELKVFIKEHKRTSYTCDINCGQVFSSKLLFQRHQRSEHREFFCTLCVKAFLTSHTCNRPYKCEVCGRGFNCSSVLNNHILIHKGEKPHVCESCGKAFTQATSLMKHQIIHQARQILACDQCDATFINEYAFNNHKALHTGEVSFVCEECNKTFCSKASLRQHMKLHGKVQFECEVCKKSFHHSHRLNQHMVVHSGVRPHVCEICSSAFFIRSGLNKHMRRVHGDNGSVCSICKTAFQSRWILKRHMLSHET